MARISKQTLLIPNSTERCCPKCGSTEFEFEDSYYGDGESFLGGDYKFYEYVCNDCDCVFREIVQEVPIGVQIKGKEYKE